MLKRFPIIFAMALMFVSCSESEPDYFDRLENMLEISEEDFFRPAVITPSDLENGWWNLDWAGASYDEENHAWKIIPIYAATGYIHAIGICDGKVVGKVKAFFNDETWTDVEYEGDEIRLEDNGAMISFPALSMENELYRVICMEKDKVYLLGENRVAILTYDGLDYPEIPQFPKPDFTE